MKFKRHDFVTYKARGMTISAIVRRAHRDGTCTVEARFVFDESGKSRPGYLGYRYRYDEGILQPAVAS